MLLTQDQIKTFVPVLYNAISKKYTIEKMKDLRYSHDIQLILFPDMSREGILDYRMVLDTFNKVIHEESSGLKYYLVTRTMVYIFEPTSPSCVMIPIEDIRSMTAELILTSDEKYQVSIDLRPYIKFPNTFALRIYDSIGEVATTKVPSMASKIVAVFNSQKFRKFLS
jgi:hypothetical protein